MIDVELTWACSEWANHLLAQAHLGNLSLLCWTNAHRSSKYLASELVRPVLLAHVKRSFKAAVLFQHIAYMHKPGIIIQLKDFHNIGLIYQHVAEGSVQFYSEALL